MPVSTYAVRNLQALSPDFTVADLNSQLSVLQQNIHFLSQVMHTAREGSALLGFNALIEPGLPVGTPVYYNRNTQRFEKSRLALIQVGDRLVAADSSDVWGIIAKLCSTDRANLLIDGIMSINMAASTGSANAAGKWYLSATAGQLQNTADDVLVAPVLIGSGDGDILFRPWFADNYARLVPKVIQISHLPAGTLNNASSVTTITGVNLTTPGWLPASSSVFNGLRPAAARFGYHWQVDPNLQNIWPPVYPGDSRLLLDAGNTNSRGYSVILGRDNDRLLIDQNGIWWCTDKTGQLPWDLPVQPDIAVPPSGAVMSPASYPRRLVFEGEFASQVPTASEQVFSLISSVPWLRFARKGSQTAASRGDLELQLLPNQWINADPADLSGVALKRLVDGRFTQGPVITSLISNSPSVTLQGSQIAEGVYAGSVGISVQASKDFDLLPLRTVLQNATDEEYDNTIAIGLRSGISSGFVTEFHIPHTVPAGSRAKFVLWILAPQAMNLPSGLTLSVRVLAVPTTATALPQEVALPITYPAGSAIAAGRYLQVESSTIEVAGGETLYVRVNRAGQTDGQSGRLDILKLVGEFV